MEPSPPPAEPAGWFTNAPLIAATLAFAAGILLPRALPVPAWLALCLAGAGVFAALAAHLARRDTLALALTLPFFLALGLLRSPLPTLPADPLHIVQYAQKQDEEVVLLGVLETTPVVREHDTRLLLDVRELWTAASRQTCRGRVQLAVAGPPVSGFAPGDTLLARAKLSIPREAGTPGAFDYRAFLAQQSIWVTGRVSDAAHLTRVAPSPPPSLLHTLRYLPERARQQIGSFLDRHLPEETRGLYRAVIIGDLTGIPAPLLEDFRSTGCMHLLAISGMNIGLITLTVTFAAWLLISRSEWALLHLSARKIVLCLTIPFMLLYAFVAGFQPPVVRALIMVLVFIAATLLDRQWQVLNNIAIAALLILAWAPADLFTVSFQLSFAAVIGISIFIEPLRRLMSADERPADSRTPAAGLRNWLVAGLLASLAATAGTLPLMLFYFNRLSLLAPISTLLVEPFLCFWAQMPGLLACLFMPLFPPAADALLRFGSLGLQASVWLVEHLARVPLREVWLPTPGIPEIAAWYVLVLTMPLWKKVRWTRYAGAGAAVLLIAIPLAAAHQRRHDTELRVHFLDVGQGSATVVELPGGGTVLIDAGGHETDRFNVGKDIVAPFLWKKRIARLDAVAITHPHADHANGLPFLVERFRPETIWLHDNLGKSPALASLRIAAERTGTNLRPVQAGDGLLTAGPVSLRCLGRFGEAAGSSRPSGEADADRETDANRGSLVLRLDAARTTFLFPGDIGAMEEQRLVAQGGDLGVDVLLAPHHGSRSSNSEPFARAVHARFVVVSSGGRKNVFPAPEVRERYETLGARLFETRRDGTITFSSSGAGLSVTPFRKTASPPQAPGV